MLRFITSTIAILSILASSASQFNDRQVKVFCPVDSIYLAGTLSVPSASTRAAILLITGSGSQNRDEEIYGHRPFKTLAEFLASNGIAVIRLDDRGVGDSDGANLVEHTVNSDLCNDALAAIAFLKKQFPDLPVGAFGHSEGGKTAYRIADSCNFIITAGAPAWPGDSILISQSRAIATALTGKWDAEPAERAFVAIATSDMPDWQKKATLIFTMNQMLGDVAALPDVKESIAAEAQTVLRPWYQDMLRYNPAPDIARVSVPWLAVNGQLDLQVLPGNLLTIKQLNPSVDILELPGHNHLLQRCTTGLPQEYPQISEDLSPIALNEILNWLLNKIN